MLTFAHAPSLQAMSYEQARRPALFALSASSGTLQGLLQLLRGRARTLRAAAVELEDDLVGADMAAG